MVLPHPPFGDPTVMTGIQVPYSIGISLAIAIAIANAM